MKIIFFITALVLLAACSPGGTAQFLDGSDPTVAGLATNPAVQLGVGGTVNWTGAGGYSGQVILKADSGSIHTGGGYTMSINTAKVQ